MNKKSQIIFLVIVLFACAIYFTYKYKETLVNKNSQCPTTLIKDGDKLLLYNPNLAKIPGVNPIQFNSLDDYEKYVEWQRVNNINCPILKLDKSIISLGICLIMGIISLSL
jgi:hypothetical protein